MQEPPLIGIYVVLMKEFWTTRQHPEEVYQTLAQNSPNHLIITIIEE